MLINIITIILADEWTAIKRAKVLYEKFDELFLVRPHCMEYSYLYSVQYCVDCVNKHIFESRVDLLNFFLFFHPFFIM